MPLNFDVKFRKSFTYIRIMIMVCHHTSEGKMVWLEYALDTTFFYCRKLYMKKMAYENANAAFSYAVIGD